MKDHDLDFLVLAPHATVPGHDGASVRSNELALGWLEAGRRVLYVAKHGNFTTAEELRRKGVPPPERSKKVSAVAALVRGVSYNAGKHVTGEWLKRAKDALRRHTPKVVYVHFLWTLPSLQRELQGAKLWVDTHNYDPEWFENIARGSRNPLQTYLAKSSSAYSVDALNTLGADVTMVHVTETDARKYALLNPKPVHKVIANGCRLQPRRSAPDYGAPRKRLYFLGLLSAKMNEDGLSYFASEVWPAIRDHAEFFVMGKSPTPLIQGLCAANGWTLKPNIPVEELNPLLETMHYSVMPFAYNAGSKTKLMDAAGRGIPILATEVGVRGYDGLPSGVKVLASQQAWKEAVMRDNIDSKQEAAQLIDLARRFAWPSLAQVVDDQALHGT